MDHLPPKYKIGEEVEVKLAVKGGMGMWRRALVESISFLNDSWMYGLVTVVSATHFVRPEDEIRPLSDPFKVGDSVEAWHPASGYTPGTIKAQLGDNYMVEFARDPDCWRRVPAVNIREISKWKYAINQEVMIWHGYGKWLRGSIESTPNATYSHYTVFAEGMQRFWVKEEDILLETDLVTLRKEDARRLRNFVPEDGALYEWWAKMDREIEGLGGN